MAESRSFSRAGVALALVVQMGCSDDGPNWNLPGSDGGLDGGGSSSSSPSDDEPPDASMGTSESTDGITVSLDSQSGATSTSSEADASVSSSAQTSGEQMSSTPEADASIGTTSETTVTETSAGTDTSTTPETTGDQSTQLSGESSETSERGSDTTSSEATTESGGGTLEGDAGPDAGAQFTSCSEECSADCFPDCIRDVIAPCQPVGTCSAEDSTYCWANQVRLVEEGDAFTEYTRVLYGADGNVCYSAESTLNPIAGTGSYLWRDAAGTAVAEGVWDFGTTVTVTCLDSGSVWDFEYPDPYYGCGAIDVYGWSMGGCEPGVCGAGDGGIPALDQ